MKFENKTLAALVLTFGAVGGAQAIETSVVNITVTGGRFNLGSPNTVCTNTAETSNFGGCVNAAVGAENVIAAGFSGGNRADALSQQPNNTLNFNFFGTTPNNRVNGEFFNSAVGAQNANDWANGFQGTVDLGADDIVSVGDVVTLNMGGWYATWNGTNFLQGTDSTGANGTSTAATGTITAVAGTTESFTVNWQSYITGGPFDTQTGYWELSGNLVAAIPEASTYGMMLAGLGLVGFAVSRRRKVA